MSLSLRAPLERRFLRHAARELERLLAETSSTLTLNVEIFAERERRHFERLLKRLSCYGDRVSIVLDESLRYIVPVDSSVFNVVLVRTAS